MTINLIYLAVGLLIGATAGVLVMALCFAARDERQEGEQ